MRDGLLGYDAWWFYEESGYDLPATWHGDTVIASVPTAIHVADCQTEEMDGCPPGQHKAKATFTIQEIGSQNPVNSATVQVTITAKGDGVAIHSETQSHITGTDGKAAFTLSSCVGCGGDLEIHFTITNVISPDDRPYEPGANLCSEAVWRPDRP
jgi:hypothetical protein